MKIHILCTTGQGGPNTHGYVSPSPDSFPLSSYCTLMSFRNHASRTLNLCGFGRAKHTHTYIHTHTHTYTCVYTQVYTYTCTHPPLGRSHAPGLKNQHFPDDISLFSESTAQNNLDTVLTADFSVIDVNMLSFIFKSVCLGFSVTFNQKNPD